MTMMGEDLRPCHTPATARMRTGRLETCSHHKNWVISSTKNRSWVHGSPEKRRGTRESAASYSMLASPERVPEASGTAASCSTIASPEGSRETSESTAACSTLASPDTCSDLFLAEARYGGLAAYTMAILSAGPCYLLQSLVDWVCEYLGYERATRAPPSWSWLSIMGSPIEQPSPATCAVAACTKCIEAQHRLAFERAHGAGTFLLEAEAPVKLKMECEEQGVWRPESGALSYKVLDVVASTQGVPTTQGVFLPLLNYLLWYPVTYQLSPYAAAWMVRKRGPVVGSLQVDFEYYISDINAEFVYRGCGGRHKQLGSHAVVCFAYKFVDGELQFRVMDNHNQDGPLRWIAYSAFQRFLLPLIEPLDSSILPHKK